MQTGFKQAFTQIRGSLVQLSHLPKALRLVWTPAPGWTTAWLVLLLIQGLLPIATVYVTRLLVDTLVQATSNAGGWEGFRPTLVLAVAMASLLLLTEILQSATEWVRANQSERIQDYIRILIHEKSIAVDLSFYDSPDYHDQLYRARQDANTRPLLLLENMGGLLQNGITLLGMASILVPYGLWLPPVLVLSTLPAFGVVLAYNWKNHQWWKQTTPDLRWTQYYDWLLTMTPGAAEIRLFGLGGHMMSAYQVIRQRLRDERLSLLKSQSFARLFAGASALLISGLVMGWMVWLAFQRRVTLGDLVLFYQAFSRGQGLMQSLLGSLGQVYSNSLFLGNLFEFLDLKPTVLEPADPANVPVRLKKGISFRNVRFCYPGNTRATLENFNLEISAGKIVAIVGLNGAGKSTLVKLLCRFYDPQAGRIELDGIDIGSFSLRELRRMISVLFQTPMHYHATAGQNITLGDISASPHDSEIEAAARGAGAHEVISALPHGYSALLGRWFVNGNELSSGQWQRIALARAFFRKAEIIILDEPTSSMDPWAETDWLERFRTLARGRTGIIITHRFTVAMRADLIHVMREGEIVESGTHDELIALGGLYSQSWSAQMQGITSSTT